MDITRQGFDDLLYMFLREIHRFQREDMLRFDLSWQDMYVLKYLLTNSPCRISDIADELEIPLFNASRIVLRLVRKGLVSKEKAEGDKRNTYVSILEEGREYIQMVKDFHFNVVSENLRDLPEDVISAMVIAVANLSSVLKVGCDS